MKKLSCIVIVLILLSLFTVNCFAEEPIKTESQVVSGYYIPGDFPEGVFPGVDDGDNYNVTTDDNVKVSITNPYDENISGFAVMPVTDEDSDTYKWLSRMLPEGTGTAAPFYMFYVGTDGKAIDLYAGTVVNITGLESQYVVGVSTDGSVTKPVYTYKDGVITFMADGSKYYVLCEAAPVVEPEVKPEQKPESVVPNTGDNANVHLWFGALALSAALLTILTVIKRKQA